MENIQAHKKYNLRGGLIAYVAAIDMTVKDSRGETVMGLILHKTKSPEMCTWQADGRLSSESEDTYDIVSEWEEPKRIMGWMALGLSGGAIPTPSNPKPTAAEAIENFKVIYSFEPTACIEIDVLEGQGLDGSVA